MYDIRLFRACSQQKHYTHGCHPKSIVPNPSCNRQTEDPDIPMHNMCVLLLNQNYITVLFTSYQPYKAIIYTTLHCQGRICLGHSVHFGINMFVWLSWRGRFLKCKHVNVVITEVTDHSYCQLRIKIMQGMKSTFIEDMTYLRIWSSVTFQELGSVNYVCYLRLKSIRFLLSPFAFAVSMYCIFITSNKLPRIILKI